MPDVGNLSTDDSLGAMPATRMFLTVLFVRSFVRPFCTAAVDTISNSLEEIGKWSLRSHRTAAAAAAAAVYSAPF